MNKAILITGGCGFIGSHFVEYVFKNTNWNIFILDKLSYSSFGLERLKSILNSERIKIFTFDLNSTISIGLSHELKYINYIVHFAAESHVDSSIQNPKEFILNNIASTINLLDFSRELSELDCFVYFSTDEVYGPALDTQCFKETDRHRPSNPYSASKSASEQICFSYFNTYNIPLIVVNVMNVFGEKQHIEKFIPKCIKTILNNEVVSIHTDIHGVESGSRSYIYVQNVSSALIFLLKHGKIGDTYNIPGEEEVSNIDLALKIAKIMNRVLNYKFVKFHNRPGHDLRYSLDGTKIKNLGWEPVKQFDFYLKRMVEWTLENSEWLKE